MMAHVPCNAGIDVGMLSGSDLIQLKRYVKHVPSDNIMWKDLEDAKIAISVMTDWLLA